MLKVKNLSVKKDNLLVLDNLNFEINQGDFIFLGGKNGSGKSTLAEALINLTAYDGSITINDREITEFSNTELTNHISVIFQTIEDYFFNSTIKDELGFLLETANFSTSTIEQLIAEQVKLYNLPTDLNINPTSLSGGEQQRLAIACATIKQPQILILDETMSMNNKIIKSKIYEHLKILNEAGMTIIVISHEIEDIVYMNQLYLLNNKIEIFNAATIKDHQQYLEEFFY